MDTYSNYLWTPATYSGPVSGSVNIGVSRDATNKLQFYVPTFTFLPTVTGPLVYTFVNPFDQAPYPPFSNSGTATFLVKATPTNGAAVTYHVGYATTVYSYGVFQIRLQYLSTTNLFSFNFLNTFFFETFTVCVAY